MSQFSENITGNTDIDTIMAMHRYMRPKGSRTEQSFIDQYLRPLGVKDDRWGNYHLTIGENPTVLWSSHTDTVHLSEGFQQVVLNEKNILTLNKRSRSNCLGADDGAGVWIMCEMIKARIPGMYIFHYGEEKGCEGSTEISKHMPEIFKGVKIAVAFDRKGNTDVITHITTRICSDEFAKSLISQLPEGYKICDTGMRTDVKLYEKLIPECVNISVGYTNPHNRDETLDLNHLILLRDKMVKIDVEKLEVKRNPSITEYKAVAHTPYRHHTGSSYEHTNTPQNLHDIVKRNHTYIADMMIRAGIKFDDLMHLVLEEQKLNPRKNWVYDDSKLVPPKDWKNPHDPASVAKTETKTESSASTSIPATSSVAQNPPSGANARVQLSPGASIKDTATHHIGVANPPDRGGGSPNNIVPLRTGNPAREVQAK